MKKCPHCKKNVIGVLDWFTASYQYPRECRDCLKLYSYSGIQILVSIALGIFYIAVVVKFGKSLSLEPLYLPLMFLPYYISAVLLMNPVKYNKRGRWCSSCNRVNTPKSSWWQMQCDNCRCKRANK